VVGSNSLVNEVELANIYNSVFSQLGIDVEIKINNRKILTALAELCGGAEKMMGITIAIDKLDKIGIDKVKEELAQRDLNKEQVEVIEQYLSISGSNNEKLDQLKSLLGEIEIGKKGIEEIEYILRYEENVNHQLQLDFTLARGLDYYTGIIFEVKAKNVHIGSIGGGGRYDNLTGLFGVNGIPGVGISFGVDRIYDVMDELNLFAEEMQATTQLLFFNLGEAESKAAYKLMQQLRSTGIRCELYPDNVKFDKQFKYADRKGIPDIAIIGSKELENKTCVVKNLKTGEQKTLALSEMADFSI
jgi:histidyl-tRNA synthetase